MILELLRGMTGAPPADRPATYQTTATLTARAYSQVLVVFLLGLGATVWAAHLQATEGYAYAIGGMVAVVAGALGYTGARGAQAHAGQYAPRPAGGGPALTVGAPDLDVPSSAAGHAVYPEEASDL